MKFGDIYFKEDVEPRAKAYWLSPSKDIIPVDGTHISLILKDPSVFGISQEYIDKTAEELGGTQELRDGGKARDAIMTDLLRKGWTRVRKVESRNADFWTLQIETGMGRSIPRLTKNSIQHWAEQMIQMNEHRGRDTVVVLNTKGEKLFGGSMLYKDQKTIMDIYLDDSGVFESIFMGSPLMVDSVDPEINTNLISEGGMSRVLDQLQNKTFAIITAHRGNYTDAENAMRNKKLRNELNANKMGSHFMVGHWQECSDETIEDYRQCPKDQLNDVVENSLLFTKPESMTEEEFISYVSSLNKKFDQDGAVLGLADGSVNIVDKNGDYFSIGNKTTLNKISQAYSQYVKKMDIPFVFEGVQVPATNIGRRLFSDNNITYPRLSREELSECKEFKSLKTTYDIKKSTIII